MPGHLQSLEGKSQVRQLAALPAVGGAGERRDARVLRADHGHCLEPQQVGNTPNMIGVMVGE
jgi:hypothetical protein